MKEFQISTAEAGQKCIKYCAKVLPIAGNSFLYKMLRKKNITVNGKKADGSEALKENDSIQFFLSDETFEKFSGRKPAQAYPSSSNTKLPTGREQKKQRMNKDETTWDRTRIIYEDADILLYNKPSGMLSQKAEPADISLNELFISYLLESGQLTEDKLTVFKPSICNRLDRNTSGIVICGKSYQGLKEMNRLIKERLVQKYYHCIVTGMVNEPILLKGYLKKDEKTNKVEVGKECFADASYIETEIKPLKPGKEYSLLEVHLITGKTHQIRSHLAFLGHPIVGDFKYGGQKNREIKQQFGISSQLLHSCRLEFPEMTAGFERLSQKAFLAPEPESFRKIASKVQLEGAKSYI